MTRQLRTTFATLARVSVALVSVGLFSFAFVSLAFVSNARAQNADPAPNPFDTLQGIYSPYMSTADPVGFPMKVRALASDEYKFWRGSKDLFFLWCKSTCQDWIKDDKSFLPNHGDLHLGNIGTYVSEDAPADAPFSKLGFGMVDFDDSARMPFEFDLLQGVITLELVARQNKIALTPDEKQALINTLFDTYKLAINSQRNATELLKADPLVASLLDEAGKKAYESDLKKFTKDGNFRTGIYKKKALTDLLDPVDPQRFDAFAQAISDAVKNDERLASYMSSHEPAQIRKLIKDVTRRTRIGSAGSQGLNKFLVLLDAPFAARGMKHDVILYLKQQIPTAAERSQIIPRDPRTPGQRCAQDTDKMTDPRPAFNSWAEMDGKSYWVYFKEPWSNELAYDEVTDAASLKQMAVIWGNVVGATHRDDGRFELVLPRFTDEVKQQVRTRADAYVAYQSEAFKAFVDNPQTKQAIKVVEAFLATK